MTTISNTTITRHATINVRRRNGSTTTIPAPDTKSEAVRRALRFAGRAMTWYDFSVLGLMATSVAAIVAAFAR